MTCTGGVESARYAAVMCFGSLACLLTEEEFSLLHNVGVHAHTHTYESAISLLEVLTNTHIAKRILTSVELANC